METSFLSFPFTDHSITQRFAKVSEPHNYRLNHRKIRPEPQTERKHMPYKIHPIGERLVTEPKNGRPRNLVMPALPAEIYGSLSELEKEHFDFFLAAMKKELPNTTPLEHIQIALGAMEYINTLRLEFEQLKTGQLVMQSRQNPSIQLREWIKGALSRHQDKKKHDETDTERAKLKEALLSLSAASGE